MLFLRKATLNESNRTIPMTLTPTKSPLSKEMTPVINITPVILSADTLSDYSPTTEDLFCTHGKSRVEFSLLLTN